MSAEVLIELDPAAPIATAPPPLPMHRYRLPGLVLCLLMALATTGAAPAAVPMWHRAGMVPRVPADAIVELAANRLYVSVSAGERRITSAYATYPMRRLWSTETPDDGQGAPRLKVTRGGVLVQVGRYTDVLDPRSGGRLWRSPVPVQPLPGGRTGLVVDPQFRPGTLYDESSGDPGMLYFTADGVSHNRPPERTVLHGVDLVTGRQQWSTSLPGAIYAAPATADPATLVVVSAQRLDLLDADTGAVRRQRSLPANRDRVTAWSEIVGGLVLISSTTTTGDKVSAYSLDTLEPRWQRTLDANDGNTRACAGLLCERRRSTLVVLDPSTGDPRWESGGPTDLQAWGDTVLQVERSGDDPRPVRVVSRVTGAPLTDLLGWQELADGPTDGPLVLSRPDDVAGTAFGVLRPGQRTVLRIGRSDDRVSSCRADARLVACRIDQSLVLFTYQA